MANLNEIIFSAIKRKGIIETLFHLFDLFYHKLISLIDIFFLRIRGYNIDFSVYFKGNITIFQSTKNAINILEKSVIGRGSRITAGDSGTILIKENTLIDDYTFVMAHEKIEIGKNTSIAAFCFIVDFNHKFDNPKVSVLSQGSNSKPVIIGDNVWIGTHVVVLPGVTIGDGAVIGAGSVVTHDIPANSISYGNPAKVMSKNIKRS